MPLIQRYGCNECDFELPSGWGGYMYAVDDVGNRRVCPHPCEFSAVVEITGLEMSEAESAGRTGYASHCVCLACVEQFDLDLERDERVCPKCSAQQVRSSEELIGESCPRCQVGLIEEGSIVRWKLDPDWENLPVPQVVKDLLQYDTDPTGPESLKPAIEAANRLGDHNFVILVARLLCWWEGDYFSEDREQQDSKEMNPRWTWCKALPDVCSLLPQLAELITVRSGRCWFADGVTPDMRRGIKNYLRKHRVHIVES